MDLAQKYLKVCEIIVNAGGTPLVVNNTLSSIIKMIIPEADLDFILAFEEKNSQTMDELKKSAGLTEDEIIDVTDRLAAKGVIFNQPSSTGLKVYRLLPLINVGVFEYMFMKKLEVTEEKKELGRLFTQLFEEHRMEVVKNRDAVAAGINQMPAVDRTVPIRTNKPTGNSVMIPVNKTIEAEEKYLLSKDVADLIEKFDEIAVGHCFCRQHKDVMGTPCKQTDLRECCFTFGKSARFTSAQGFMRMIDKKEALEILYQTEEDGLVHKVYHPKFDVTKDETSVCNCCKCCCGNSVVNQKEPIINAANFLAQVDPETCIGCGTCLDYCHSDAIALTDEGVCEVDATRCFGCGACAHICPEDAVRLTENHRIVRIPMPEPEK